MNIRIIDNALQSIKSKPDLYLFYSPELPYVSRLIFGVMSDAMHLGAANLSWASKGELHIVYSSGNWMDDGNGRIDVNLFKNVVPLKGASPNSIRHEVCIGALCSHVLIFEDSRELLIQGEIDLFDMDWIKEIRSSVQSFYGVAFVI